MAVETYAYVSSNCYVLSGCLVKSAEHRWNFNKVTQYDSEDIMSVVVNEKHALFGTNDLAPCGGCNIANWVPFVSDIGGWFGSQILLNKL